MRSTRPLNATVTTLLIAVATACGGPESRSDIAAEAGGATLAPAQLGEWVAKVPGRQPTARDAEFVAIVWTDYTLLALALEQGQPLTDAATMDVALAPDLALQTLRSWHDTMVARRPPIAPGLIDSMYTQDSVRVFQHILLRVSDPQDVRQVGAARALADSLFRQAQDSTSDFSALARARSQDSATASTGGFLPVGGRGTMPPEFERNAWQIGPGQVAGLASRFGVHIVRRPPLAEVRERITQYAESLATRRADASHLDSLTSASGLVVTDQAVSSLRAFFADPSTRTAGTALATWKGGQLGLPEVARWIDVLPPRGYLDLRGASDLGLEAFVKELAQQQLLLQEATSAGIAVSPADRATLDSAYLRNLSAAVALLGVTDSARTVPAGEGAKRVASLLEGLTTNRQAWRPLPGALGAVLRERAGYRLHQGGIGAALEAARAARPTTP
jgi:hypothetical protein